MGAKGYSYKTIIKPSEEVLFKDRGSKFYGYVFPVTSEDDIRTQIESVRQKHHSARHFCYAWQLGVNYDHYRVNDDGEPSNSAGQPIYGQIQSFKVTNVLVLVVRYFGGTKLGVGGLIQAYKESARMALDVSEIKRFQISSELRLFFDYPEMNNVMRLIKQERIQIVEQRSAIKCELVISVPKKKLERFLKSMEPLHKVRVVRADQEDNFSTR